MRAAIQIGTVAVAIVLGLCLSQISLATATATAATGTGRQVKKVQVARAGVLHNFELSRAAEFSAPFFALRKQMGPKFKDVRYKNFFKFDGTPLDEYGALPDEVRF